MKNNETKEMKVENAEDLKVYGEFIKKFSSKELKEEDEKVKKICRKHYEERATLRRVHGEINFPHYGCFELPICHDRELVVMKEMIRREENLEEAIKLWSSMPFEYDSKRRQSLPILPLFLIAAERVLELIRTDKDRLSVLEIMRKKNLNPEYIKENVSKKELGLKLDSF